MKKYFGLTALVLVVTLGVWGYRKAKEALIAPLPLVEETVGPYYAVFSDEATTDRVEEKKRLEALAAALKGAGIIPRQGIILWQPSHGGLRSGQLIEAVDFPKTRHLARPLSTVELSSQT